MAKYELNVPTLVGGALVPAGFACCAIRLQAVAAILAFPFVALVVETAKILFCNITRLFLGTRYVNFQFSKPNFQTRHPVWKLYH